MLRLLLRVDARVPAGKVWVAAELTVGLIGEALGKIVVLVYHPYSRMSLR